MLFPVQLHSLWIVSAIFALTQAIKQVEISDNDPTMAKVKPTATKGMVIDAGSGGSRLHVFTWQPRIFDTVPPPLSYPEANERWTARISPGIDYFANDLSGIEAHLGQLIDFAKLSLVGFEKEFADYPIYFKATGGMREVDSLHREAIISEVRRLLSDKTFCPFFFRDDFARVISGEEEAIFSWSATNFLMGTLLPNSQGIGEVTDDVNSTYGTLDLGGASTQIAFFVPSQDISEGLYKLQLGGQKQWNVYTKSFLQFGVNSARLRHTQTLVDNYIQSIGGLTTAVNSNTRYTVINQCFPSGYSEIATDSTNTVTVDLTGPPTEHPDQLPACRTSLKPLMEREVSKFCDKVYHGDCSIAGAYQPPVPTGEHGHFIGTSSYKYPWSFLQLPKTATLDMLSEKSNNICAMNLGELNYYYQSNFVNSQPGGDVDKLGDQLPYYCFLSSYVLTLLEDGYRFNHTQTLTVLDEVKGHKVGWALGAILYEINELPWVLKLSPVEQHPYGFVFLAAVIGFFIGVIAALFIYREIIEDHRPNNLSRQGSYDNIGLRMNTIDVIRRKMAPHGSSNDSIDYPDDDLRGLQLQSPYNANALPSSVGYGRTGFVGSPRSSNGGQQIAVSPRTRLRQEKAADGWFSWLFIPRQRYEQLR